MSAPDPLAPLRLVLADLDTAAPSADALAAAWVQFVRLLPPAARPSHGEIVLTLRDGAVQHVTVRNDVRGYPRGA